MHYLGAHSYLLGAIGMWLLSAAVSTMPPLTPSAGYGLRWLYGFLQALAANIDKLKNAAQPPLK
jgi:hypothetical protein